MKTAKAHPLQVCPLAFNILNSTVLQKENKIKEKEKKERKKCLSLSHFICDIIYDTVLKLMICHIAVIWRAVFTTYSLFYGYTLIDYWKSIIRFMDIQKKKKKKKKTA